jgi:hypothetical protein
MKVIFVYRSPNMSTIEDKSIKLLIYSLMNSCMSGDNRNSSLA